MVVHMQRCVCGRVCWARGKCRRCYDARRRSEQRFDGQREQTIVRDGGRCRGCSSAIRIVVHHRPVGFITLCRRCHPRIHLLYRLPYGLSPVLGMLWAELHRGQPEQMLLPGFEPRALAAAA